MADGVEFSLTGLDSLLGKLDSVSDDLRRKGGRAALRKAGNVVVNKAKANARRIDDAATGRSIADNIALRWNGRLFKQTGNLGFRIGVVHGAVLKNNPDKGRMRRRRTGAYLSLVQRKCVLSPSCARHWKTALTKSPPRLLMSMRRRWTGP